MTTIEPTDATVGCVRSYREYPPPRALYPALRCGWSSSTAEGEPAHHQRVVPDACIDLMFTEGQLIVAGPDTRPFIAAQASGSEVTGLRFAPGAAPSVLGVPAAAIADRRVELAELHPRMARTASALLDRGAPAPVALARAVADALGSSEGPDPAAARILRLTSAGLDASATADALGWTTRTLRRHAHACYGYGPATLRRVLRFDRALRLLRAGVPAAEAAARAGYADQPHLSREIRTLAGVAVGEL